MNTLYMTSYIYSFRPALAALAGVGPTPDNGVDLRLGRRHCVPRHTMHCCRPTER